MYAKLAFRNARRSVRDYALYLTTMMVLSVLITFSNLLSGASNMVDGVQASSLPLIIAVIMAVLLHYINRFMLRCRGRELATYILLGMSKHLIAFMFFIETFLLGAVCFFIGIVIGSLLFSVIIRTSALSMQSSFGLSLLLKSTIASFIYFFGVQVICGGLSYFRVSKLQINQLLITARKNETMKRPKPMLWSVLFSLSFGLFLTLVWIIVKIQSQTLVMLAVSIISMPLLFTIFAFYKSLFLWLNFIRNNHRIRLYSGNRIYFTAQILSKPVTDVRLYTVLSVCLLFSAICFIAGIIMRVIPDTLFSNDQSSWMSFVQICLSITFIVIYFSILSVKQVIDVHEGRLGRNLMGCLGKNRKQLMTLILKESCLKFCMPTVICVLILFGCIVPLNALLNVNLAETNIALTALGVFAGCFCCLYLLYFTVIYKLSSKV